MILVLIVLIEGAIAVVGALLLLRFKSRWPASRIALASALPIPLALIGLGAFVAGYPRLVKRVDGQPMELAFTILAAAFMLYVFGYGTAFLIAKVRKRRSVDVEDVFS